MKITQRSAVSATVLVLIVLATLLFITKHPPKQSTDSLEQSSFQNSKTDSVNTESVIATTSSYKLVQPPTDWRTYTYVNYKINFPSDPRITGNEKDSGGVTYATLAPNHAAYFLTVSNIPEDVMKLGTEKILSVAISSTVKNLGGTLNGAIDTKNLTGFDSVDFVVGIPDGPRTYMARDIVIDDKLVELRVIYVDSHGEGVQYRGFVDSFIPIR